MNIEEDLFGTSMAETPEVTPTPTPAQPEPTPATPAPAASAGINKDDIANVVRGVLEAQTPQKEMTAEERAQHLRVWNPNEEFVNDFVSALQSDDASQRVAAFAELRDGLMQQAMRAAELMVEQRFGDLDSRVSPLLQQQQEARRAEAANQFVTKYPAFKGMEDLAHQTAEQLVAGGAQFQSQDEFFQAVANNLETLAKRINPSFSLGAQAAPQASSMPSMASTAVMTSQASSHSAGASNGLKPSVW